MLVSSRRPAGANAPLVALLLAAVVAIAGPPAHAGGVSLHSGDIVVLALENTYTPGILLRVNVATGAIDSLWPNPPLPSPQDLAVRSDGMIMVADAVLGLVAVQPGNGAATVIAGPAAFGGSGPTTLAFTPDGDLLLAGPGGVHRVPAGTGAPELVSPTGILVNPRGITADGVGNIWVGDAGNSFPTGGDVVHVDAATGAQSVLAVLILPHQIRVGSDGSLYVVCAPFGGPTNYLNGGVYKGGAALGDFAMWFKMPFIRGFVTGPGGVWWVMYGRDISRGPYDGIIQGSGPDTYYTGARGPIALVPPGVVPTHPTTWGALKNLYR